MRTAAQTAFLMAIFTLVSKCLGFIREMVMANYFGATYITDAYTMSLTILTVLFMGIIAAVSTAYMPLYSKIIENTGHSEGVRFTNGVINCLLLISILISIIGILFSDQLIAVLASGLTGKTAALASYYIKVLFSYIIFSSTASILESYLQYKGVFLPQIFSGYFISICTIVAIIISAYTSCYFLAYGMVIGYALRFFAIFFIARRKGYHHSFRMPPKEAMREIITLAIPTFIGSYVVYINQFVDKTLASRLAEGSIAALNYAVLLNGMIVGITISVLSTIIYPKLTQANSLEQYERFNSIADKGLHIILIIALPLSLGSMLYSHQVVQIVYERGAFDSVATLKTSAAFFYYSLGLVFTSLNDLLTRIYYAMRNMKNPMIFAGIGVIINIMLNLILVQFMGIRGLALATSTAAFFNTILLIAGIHKNYKSVHLLRSKRKLAKITFASIVSVGISYIIYLLVVIPLNHIIVARIVQLFIAVFIAVIIYLILLFLLKVDEIKLVGALIRKDN